MTTNKSVLLENNIEFQSDANDVALKVPTKYFDNKNAAVNEIKILNGIGQHLNILEFSGFSLGKFSSNEIYNVTEFCETGSVLKYLLICNREGGMGNKRIFKHITTLLRFSHEISLRMEFFHFQKIIHGELAARNVFIDATLIGKLVILGYHLKIIIYLLTKFHGSGDRLSQ